MAYQPKSYRKFLAGTVTAAVVASAIGPVAASAAEVNFSDVTADHMYFNEITALAGLNVIKGYEDGEFKPERNITRAQVTVMVYRALKDQLEVPSDLTSFNDLPADATQELKVAAAALKAEGIIKGSENGTKLRPSDSLNRQEMATILVRAFGLEAKPGVEVNFSDIDQADAAHRENILILAQNEITTGKDNGTWFDNHGLVSRQHLAVFAYRALGLVEVAPEVSSVSAITAKSLKVSFNKAVAGEDATFEVKKGAVKVNTSDVSWNEDKTEATIVLAGKLTKGEYTVNVTGLTDEALTGAVTVEDEKVAKIEVLSSEAPLVDSVGGDTDIDDLQVGYRVLNQYGEDITKTTSLTTSSNNVSVNPATGIVTIEGNYNTTTNKLATFTLIHAQSATTASATVTAVSEAKVSEVEIKGLYNKDAKTLTETTNLSDDLFYVELELKDQYGNVVTDASKLGELLVTESNPTVADAAATATVIEVNGQKKVVVALTGAPVKGSNIVTVIAKASGKSDSFTVEVAESTRAYNVDVAAPAIAVAGETTDIPVTVTDKEGNLITDINLVKNATRGIKISVDGIDRTSSLVVKNGAVVLPQSLNQGYSSIVAISNATQSVDTLTLEVKAAAKPVIVTGLKSSYSTTFKAGQTKTIAVGDLVIEDQYGRVMSATQVNNWLDLSADNKIVITENETSNIVAISNTPADTDIAATSETVSVVGGTTKGSEKITVTLHDATGAIVSSAKEVSLRVTDGSEYVSYEVGAIGTVYDEAAATKTDNAAYDKTVVVKGILSDGSKVTLTNGTDYAVTSTNATTQADVTDGVLDVSSAYTTYGNNSSITVPVTVTINATGEKFNQEVTVSKSAPTVSSLTVVEDGKGADFIAGLAVDTLDKFNFDAATNGVFTFADLDAAADVVATDQYGTSVILDGTDQFADTTAIGDILLTFTKVSGNLTFTGNGTDSATVAQIPANSEFNLVLSTAGVTLATSPVKVTATSRQLSVASYTPVTLSQTGTVTDGNVQYATAAAVIAALPTTISVRLADGSTANIPVTWADTDTYDNGTAADYTFTATWGTLPTGVNNSNSILAPTVEVTVAP
ncbi:S-layer homology domain-containing protein [Bacillus sp. AK128]